MFDAQFISEKIIVPPVKRYNLIIFSYSKGT